MLESIMMQTVTFSGHDTVKPSGCIRQALRGLVCLFSCSKNGRLYENLYKKFSSFPLACAKKGSKITECERQRRAEGKNCNKMEAEKGLDMM
jgi:hypothetical protein